MDFKAAADELGLEEEEFYEIVELFLSTAESEIKTIQSTYETNDREAMGNAAHSLKGASGTLGFADISALAKKLEENAKAYQPDELEQAITYLKEKLEGIRIELAKMTG